MGLRRPFYEERSDAINDRHSRRRSRRKNRRCARHGRLHGGESPLRTLVTGTVSGRQGRRREAGSEGSRKQNRDARNTKRRKAEGMGEPA
jgi:hypothetical protein